ncbi:NAD(P)H-binding protein [Micrococcaceae bacterium Sec5.7]
MILLAGGTGTLGTAISAKLQGAGRPFRVLTRSNQRAAALRKAGIDAVIGDVERPADADRAVQGCAAVVSAISGFGPDSGSSPAAVDRAGNFNLMAAAARNGARRFILFSMRGAGPDHRLELARMKFEAEQQLHSSGLKWTVIRPTTILESYAGIMGASLQKSGTAAVFGRGDKPINFVSAQDLSAAVVLALDGGLEGQALDVGGPDNLTLTRLAAILVELNGAGRTVHVPLPVLRTAAVGARLFGSPWGRVLQAAVQMGVADMSFDAVPGRESLPGVPFTPVREALRPAPSEAA